MCARQWWAGTSRLCVHSRRPRAIQKPSLPSVACKCARRSPTRAGNPPQYYSGVCQQDSGGPLFLPSSRRSEPDVLYGVVSNGNGKCIGAPGDEPQDHIAAVLLPTATCVNRQKWVAAREPTSPAAPVWSQASSHAASDWPACPPLRAAQMASPALRRCAHGSTGRRSSCWRGAGPARVSAASRRHALHGPQTVRC